MGKDEPDFPFPSLSSAPLTPQVVEQLVTNQTRELELKAADLALQQQKDSNGFAYATKTVEATLADRKDERLHRRQMADRLFFFCVLIAFIVCLLLIFCLASNHEAIAIELIKLFGTFGAGAAGGYGFGKRSTQSHSKEEPRSID